MSAGSYPMRVFSNLRIQQSGLAFIPKHFYYLGVFLLFGFSAMKAQSDRVQFNMVPEIPYYSQHFLNSNNGLLQNEVNGLHLGKNRILWVATNFGLARYSGRSCDVFTSANDSVLKEDRIRGFYKDLDGGQMVQVANYDYVKLGDSALRVEPITSKRDYLLRDRSIIADASLIGHASGFILPLDSLRAFEIKVIEDGEVNFMQNVGKTKMPYKLYGIDEEQFFSIGRAAFFASSEGYIIHFNQSGLDTLLRLPGFGQGKPKNFHLIWNGDYVHCYFIINDALYRLSGDPTEIRLSLMLKGLPQLTYRQCIESVFDSRIFLGTRTNGVVIISPSCIKQVFNPRDGNENAVPYNLIAVGRDSLMSAAGLLYTRDTLLLHCDFGASNYNKPLALDSLKQRLYYFSYETNALAYLDLKTEELIFLSKDSSPGVPLAMTFHQGELYAFIEKYGIVKLVNSKFEVIFPLPEGVKPDMARHISFKEDSSVYMAYGYNADPLIFDLKSGKIDTLELPGKSLKTCRFIWEHESYIWITTYGDGIYVKGPDGWTRFKPKGYPQLAACHAIVSNREDLIFSTNDGLFAFNYEEVIAHLENPEKNLMGYGFSEMDGLLEKEFNGGVQYPFAQASRNYLAFPNLLGVTFLNKAYRRYIAKFQGELFLESATFRYKDTVLPLREEIPSDYNQIHIGLVQVYYGNSENAPIFYRIPEIEDVWNAFDVSKGIDISRLPSDQDYSIEVYSPTAIEPYKVQRVASFRVQPTFYQTSAFYVVLFGTVMVVVSFILIIQDRRNRAQKARLQRQINLRTKDLAEKNISLEVAVEALNRSKNDLKTAVEARSRMIAILSHDIRGPLKYMLGFTEGLIRDNSGTENEPKLKALEQGISMAYGTANLVLDQIHDLNFKQEEKTSFKLSEMVEEISKGYETLFTQFELSFTWKLEGDAQCFLPPITLKTILQNTIGNALKFCRSKVWLKVELASEICFIEVNDDGKGVLSSSALQRLNSGKSINSKTGFRMEKGKGVGTLMVWELVQQLGGKINYTNTNEGFRVAIEIPIGKP